MDDLRGALEHPPPSMSDISESMDDLDVAHADSGCGSEGCKEVSCCRGGENMDLDTHKSALTCTDCSSGESFNHLLQRCMDVVSELGLPQELIGHIQALKSTQ